MVLTFLFWTVWASTLAPRDSTDELLALSRLLMLWAVMGGAVMVVRRDATAELALSAGGAAALLLHATDAFATVVHPALIGVGAYPGWFGRGSTDQQSPQYAMILFSLLVAALLAAQVSRRGTRTMGRVAAAMVTVSVLSTGWLFHRMVGMEIRHSEESLRSEARMAVTEASEEGFLFFCKSRGSSCGTSPRGEAPDVSVFREAFRPHARTTAAMLAERGFASGDFVFWRQTVSTDDFNRLPTGLLAMGVAPGGGVRMWADERVHRAVMGVNEKVYSILALCAHSVWFFGGYGLLWFHRRAARRKALSKTVEK